MPGHGGEGGHGPVTQARAGLGRAGPLAADIPSLMIIYLFIYTIAKATSTRT